MSLKTGVIGLTALGGLMLPLLGVAQSTCDGTVTLSVSGNGNSVLVQGDKMSNCIDIEAAGGFLFVEGMGDTTITGDPVVSIADKTQVVVRMRHGDDEVRFFGVDSPDLSWTVKANAGHDFVGFGAGGFSVKKLNVDMGPGDDQVDIEGNVVVLMPSSVDAGLGEDTLEIAIVQAVNISGGMDLRKFESIVSLGPS